MVVSPQHDYYVDRHWAAREAPPDKDAVRAPLLSTQHSLMELSCSQCCMPGLLTWLICAGRADEGDFVNLQQKHNFSMAHFGMMLGMLRCTLSELQIQHCNDFFSMGQGALSAISCLPRLRVLRIEDLHCRVDKAALAELARLTQVSRRSHARQLLHYYY